MPDISKKDEEKIFVDLGGGVSVSSGTKNKKKKSNIKEENIEDAQIQEEIKGPYDHLEKNDNKENDNKEKDKKEQNKKTSIKIDDKKDKNKKEETKKSPETINVDDLKKEDKNEDVTIDFMNADESEDFIKKKTKTSDLKLDIEEDKESEFEGKSSDEIREQIKQEEEEQSNKFEPKDYEEIALIIIDVIDMLMSALLRWWAKDTAEQAYSLNKTKKERLSYQLTLLLIKHQKKWSIELMFCLTVIAVYSGPFLAARSHRKKVKEGNTPKRGKGTQNKH